MVKNKNGCYLSFNGKSFLASAVGKGVEDRGCLQLLNNRSVWCPGPRKGESKTRVFTRGDVLLGLS